MATVQTVKTCSVFTSLTFNTFNKYIFFFSLSIFKSNNSDPVLLSLYLNFDGGGNMTVSVL